jgi:hypothetical protein
VDWRNLGDRFDFNDDTIFDDEVRAKSHFQANVLVNHGDYLLLHHSQSPFSKFMGENFFVHGFQQPRA